MPGFAAPGVLFFHAHSSERDLAATLAKALLGRYRLVEPCAGAFAMSLVYRQCGHNQRYFDASDVSFFSTVLGYAITATPFEDLGAEIDGVPYQPTGNHAHDAATLILEQYRLGLEKKEGVYWTELLKSLVLRKDQHLDSLAHSIKQMTEKLRGMRYRPLCMWRHLGEVADAPRALVCVNPPSYKGGFEKFFYAGERLKWNEPEYEIFDPGTDYERLYRESRNYKALVVCLQEAEVEATKPGVFYARHVRPGANVYVWSNRPDEIKKLTGVMAVPRSMNEPEKLPYPIIRPDYEITPETTIALDRMSSANAPYYKDLWIHRIEPKFAAFNFALYLNGRLAGIAGYDARAINKIGFRHDKGRNDLILTYAVAAPHRGRLTRLVTMLALTRYAVDRFVDPWSAVRSKSIVTIEMSRYPEAKGLRGLMKLESRKEEKGRYRLVYVADIVERIPHETLQAWLRKEQEWKRSRESRRPATNSVKSGDLTSATT